MSDAVNTPFPAVLLLLLPLPPPLLLPLRLLLLLLQVLMFSATLHSLEVKRLAAAICHQPMLVDLKGKDAVPDTVDHVLLRLDPAADATWLQSTPKVWVMTGRESIRLCV
jgi:superfamily II DNA/RNA helicase